MSSSGPENRFLNSIHRLLPRVHKEKMHNMFRGGTADVWYSGAEGDLWVEYKYIHSVPGKVLPNLSSLQQAWLNSRHAEGRRVLVIVGHPGGGVILSNREWMEHIPKEVFLERTKSKKEIAAAILSITGEAHELTAADIGA